MQLQHLHNHASGLHVPRLGVPASVWPQLEDALATARIDQTLVLGLITGGFGGTDLARCLAAPLLDQLQRTEPVPAEWSTLVLQALRDPREVWETAYVGERARLRAHLQQRPGLLLHGLYLTLLRPWSLPPSCWRQRLTGLPVQGQLTWPSLRATRVECEPVHRRDAYADLQRLWRDTWGLPLTDTMLHDCLARARRLNRQEPGLWEPLVALDVVRAHRHGSRGLEAVLEQTHLRSLVCTRTDAHPVVRHLLRVAEQARYDHSPGPPLIASPSPRRALLLSGLLVLPAVTLQGVPAATRRPATRALASFVSTATATPADASAAPWPLPTGSRAGALTREGPLARGIGLPIGGGVAAVPASPPFVADRSSGLRPEEARTTVASRFTSVVSARWLGVCGRSASDFNAAVHALLSKAGVTASERRDPDVAVSALFERGDAHLAAALQDVELPLLARRLVDRASATTRIYLLTLALSRVYARIQPRTPGDPELRQAARWMSSADSYFRSVVSSDSVRASVSIGDTARWLATPPTTTDAPPLTCAQAIADAWDPDFRPDDALAWPYGSPQFRSSGWFAHPAPAADRPTLALAGVVFSLANPVLEMIQSDYDPHALPTVNASHWQQRCSQFAQETAVLDTAACLQVAWHRLARQVSQFMQRRALIDASDDSLNLRVQLRGLMLPLHRAVERLEGPCAAPGLHARARRSLQQFLGMVRLHQQMRQRNATALADSVLATLPGNNTALAAVLQHVLPHAGFPDLDDLEITLGQLYASNATQALIARVLGLPHARVDTVVNRLFFMRLAEAPLPASARTPPLLAWQRELGLRTAPGVLRGEWITRLSPAQAAALFERDDRPGLQALLEAAVDIRAEGAARWRLWQQAPQRLAAWLESTAGQQRMADVLGPAVAGTRFLFNGDGLPAPLALALLRRAVQHPLGDAAPDTLETLQEQARQAPSPVLSLAVALRLGYPLLTAQTCLSHAAVLLADSGPWETPASFALEFPLPASPANATVPALALTAVLRDAGIELLEQIDPALLPGQTWELLASTHGFQHVAQRLQGNSSGAATAQQAVARWMLDHGIGQNAMSRMVTGLDDERARDQLMQTTREQLHQHLPPVPSALARAVLWWLLVRHAGRPEWAVPDLPDDLDYGRSLRSVSFLQATALCEAAVPDSAAALGVASLAELPGPLSAHVSSDEDHGAALLQAQARPALLYAAAHQRVHLPNGPSGATAAQTRDALEFLRERQAAVAAAATQLLQPAPQRRPLAARQLRDAGIPQRYWNQTLAQIPDAVLNAGGVIRRTTRDSGLDGISLVFGAALRSMRESLVADSLQALLVGGAVELAGQPSIAQLFDQRYALYQQQMTDALAVLLARSMDGLPTVDRQHLERATVTPLLVPGVSHGVLLRCVRNGTDGTDVAPVFLAVIPAAGYAVRLQRGDRRIDGQWQRGVLYPHDGFVSGAAPDRIAPDQLRFLDVPSCIIGGSHCHSANNSDIDSGLLHAMADLMYGDFFTRTRDTELSRLTGEERLDQLEAEVADALARFAVPFYGCARDLATDDTKAAVIDCTLDALSLLLPESGVARFLRSSTELVARAGELSVRALLQDAGAALLHLGEDLAAQSGLRLLHDLGHGVVQLGRRSALWLLEHVPALESRFAHSAQMAEAIHSTFVLDRGLLEGEAPTWMDLAGRCTRVRRQVNVGRCNGEAITLFDFSPSPTYDTPGEVTWFAGMQIASDEPITDAGRRFIVDGEYWLQTVSGSAYRFARDSSRTAPALRARIRATILGGESQLLRIELHNPYPNHLLRMTQGAVVGRAGDGSRVLITRVAPGRFYLAALLADAEPSAGMALEFWPLEQQGFAPAQNDAVKTAWWGAFHYSQQCQLSGAALVDRFGSQLQQQLEQLDDLGRLLQEVRANSPYTFHNLPAQAVMSCAQSNCRYVQTLREQIGPAHWRAPRADDTWIDDALRDLLNPPGTVPAAVFTTLDDTLEARFLTPRRGAAKTLAIAEVTLKDDPVPLLFHATSGQRKGRSLLPLSNLERRHAPAGWQVDGRTVTTPHARYIDAQPSVTSIAQGDVSRVVPNHSLHVDDLDGQLFHERNARHLDAERNLYYRIERTITEGTLDPSRVTSLRLFSSRRICASCHISVGSLRARFPGAHFEVVEREVQAAGAALDSGARTGS
ncbi:hypothetical protein [Stenotrophomonas oahuensis]|uniref:Uncharacterized protein n=1 Tax=Stenotrophomonas oahuensis TaxID=3003271 RepID=A0ABY9YK49_9GAMM|nr:hypothetical protein [Stenotrophomonas sp. A5586]WNH51267.1 hypothetical protein PDM29_12925 [Stenotrophomonas sp. A5586]